MKALSAVAFVALAAVVAPADACDATGYTNVTKISLAQWGCGQVNAESTLATFMLSFGLCVHGEGDGHGFNFATKPTDALFHQLVDVLAKACALDLKQPPSPSPSESQQGGTTYSIDLDVNRAGVSTKFELKAHESPNHESTPQDSKVVALYNHLLRRKVLPRDY